LIEFVWKLFRVGDTKLGLYGWLERGGSREIWRLENSTAAASHKTQTRQNKPTSMS
jgi:hypothetical protein